MEHGTGDCDWDRTGRHKSSMGILFVRSMRALGLGLFSPWIGLTSATFGHPGSELGLRRHGIGYAHETRIGNALGKEKEQEQDQEEEKKKKYPLSLTWLLSDTPLVYLLGLGNMGLDGNGNANGSENSRATGLGMHTEARRLEGYGLSLGWIGS